MRILLTANGYPPSENGGVETYTFNLAHQLVRRGHSVHILSRMTDFDRSDLSVRREIIDQIEITRIINDFKEITRFDETYRNAAIEKTFQNILADEKPDLVHYNHLLGLSVHLPEISAAAGIPSLYMIHDFWLCCARINLVDWLSRQCPGPLQGGDCLTCMTAGIAPIKANLLRRLKEAIPFHWRQTLRRNLLQQGSNSYLLKMHPQDFSSKQSIGKQSVLQCDRILAPSEFVRRVFTDNGYPAERMEVLPLGIDQPAPAVETPAKEESATIHFGFIGSLLPSKGLDTLLNAFTQLSRPEARLLIFGDDRKAAPEFRSLLDQKIGSDSRIKYLGPFNQDQRTGVYRQIDVLVIPSRQPETFSLVAREALVHGKPVIAVQAGALTEIISPGANGLFFPPDDVDALVGCMQQVCVDPTWLLSINVRDRESIPLIEEHTARIEEIYRQMVFPDRENSE